MCGNCKEKGGCVSVKIAKWLMVVGGINWGLVGLGMLLGGGLNSWNLVHMIFGSMPTVEGIVYVLVGVATVIKIFGCKCKKCKDSVCPVEVKEEKKEGVTM